ncbi:MAG: metallophosphoesterase [bacterium]|nr:metallophosphoesterase [bacterium]
MRIGIFGDIHGDLEPLQRVMEALERESLDAWVCTGDLVVHGDDPEGCVRLFRERPHIRCVKGNHDHGASTEESELEHLRFFSRAAHRHTLETRALLSPESIRYLRELPDTLTVADATVTHATLRSRFELLNNVFTIEQMFRDMTTPLIFAGHSHRSLVHRLERGRVATFRPIITGRPVKLVEGVPTIVNVGNTAQLLYDRFPPVYVVYDTEAREITFTELPHPD